MLLLALTSIWVKQTSRQIRLILVVTLITGSNGQRGSVLDLKQSLKRVPHSIGQRRNDTRNDPRQHR